MSLVPRPRCNDAVGRPYHAPGITPMIDDFLFWDPVPSHPSPVPLLSSPFPLPPPHHPIALLSTFKKAQPFHVSRLSISSQNHATHVFITELSYAVYSSIRPHTHIYIPYTYISSTYDESSDVPLPQTGPSNLDLDPPLGFWVNVSSRLGILRAVMNFIFFVFGL